MSRSGREPHFRILLFQVWFKNRRAKMKRENKDGKVASPSSPTSTTPSPKTSTSTPPFPTPLYPGSYSTSSPFSSMGGKTDLIVSNSYYPSPYAAYPHSTVPANNLTAHAPPGSKTHMTGNSVGHAHSVTDSTYGHSDVTSSYNIKCEPSDRKDFHASPINSSSSTADRTETPASSTQAQSPASDDV